MYLPANVYNLHLHPVGVENYGEKKVKTKTIEVELVGWMDGWREDTIDRAF